MTQVSKTPADPAPVRLLAIGDVHLGTRPGSLPETLSDWGIEPLQLTPEAALEAAIDHAVSLGVDAVLFAGDVVDSTNARFEAIRPLERAVGRLAEAGIPVIAVAGNHDVEALPRLAGLIDGFTLIGEGGSWESRVVHRGETPVAEIVGWSFPQRQVDSSPVAQLLRAPLAPAGPGLPRLGLLHGDLDASGGIYAPFARRELDAAGLDAWLLGHIHRPSLADVDGSDPRGYLGSLVGLDPSETGPHGPWVITADTAGRVKAEQIPMAPLRWELIDVPVSEMADLEDVEDHLLNTATRVATEIERCGPAPRALGIRVRLTGDTRLYGPIRKRIADGAWRGIARAIGSTVVFIDKVLDELRIAIDLVEVARGDDPPGLLARKLIALESSGDDAREILEGARSALRGLAEDGRWLPLEDARDADDPLANDVLRSLLRRAGAAALHELLAQSDSRAGDAA